MHIEWLVVSEKSPRDGILRPTLCRLFGVLDLKVPMVIPIVT